MFSHEKNATEGGTPSHLFKVLISKVAPKGSPAAPRRHFFTKRSLFPSFFLCCWSPTLNRLRVMITCFGCTRMLCPSSYCQSRSIDPPLKMSDIVLQDERPDHQKLVDDEQQAPTGARANIPLVNLIFFFSCFAPCAAPS